MATERNIDWRAWINRLLPCYGCGKLGLPRRGHAIPDGWKVIYQPHPEGRPGLHVCSSKCQRDVLEAMRQGPVMEPLGMPSGVVLPAEVMQSIRREVEEAMEEEKKEKRVVLMFPAPSPEVPLEAMHPIKRAGQLVRRTRVKRGLSLREAASKVDALLAGDDSFSPVVLGQIERSMRPPDKAEAGAIAKVLDIQEATLVELSELWGAILWSGKGGKVVDTDVLMQSVPVLDPARLLDELKDVVGILSNGVFSLETCARILEGVHPEPAQEASATASLMRQAILRIQTILNPDVVYDDEEVEGE